MILEERALLVTELTSNTPLVSSIIPEMIGFAKDKSIFKSFNGMYNKYENISKILLFPKIDDEYPATMSSNIINGILREDFGYDGVIISDDMTMGAIVQNYSIEDAAVRFLSAGGDILLVCHGEENPDIIILDEPINALDEKGVKEIREILLSLRSQERIIIVACHDKEELEILSDEIVEIYEGNVISK